MPPSRATFQMAMTSLGVTVWPVCLAPSQTYRVASVKTPLPSVVRTLLMIASFVERVCSGAFHKPCQSEDAEVDQSPDSPRVSGSARDPWSAPPGDTTTSV